MGGKGRLILMFVIIDTLPTVVLSTISHTSDMLYFFHAGVPFIIHFPLG